MRRIEKFLKILLEKWHRCCNNDRRLYKSMYAAEKE